MSRQENYSYTSLLGLFAPELAADMLNNLIDIADHTGCLFAGTPLIQTP